MERYLILVMSDSHIHERADWFPNEFVELFKNRRYDVVIHAGDVVDQDVLDYVKSLGKKTYVVQGNMDYLDLPEEEIVDVFGVKIGVVHGDQVRPRGNIGALTMIAKSVGASILVSGHTHSPFITVDSGVLHVNPGSITGVWGGGGGSFKPSFIEIELYRNWVARIVLYEIEKGRIVTREETVTIYPTQ
ncbi:MAG: YfcE family phosphodiesterase [Ignisphaera sp.]